MQAHELKVWPEYYAAIVSGNKRFEVRKNDRDFHVGDQLHLREWDRDREIYTGHSINFTVTYVLHGGAFGIEKGFCVLGLGCDVK